MEVENKNKNMESRLSNLLGGVIDEAEPFMHLMMQYRCAMLEVTTKLEVLNNELSMQNNSNPFESIKCRLKTPESIVEKMQRRGIEFSVKNVEENLTDIAGVRVICSFISDIYRLADCLASQDDIIVVARKDYIKQPKENGYRSLHLILDVPIFLTNEKKHMKVEVQFRTIAMDFWASLDHKVEYKKKIQDSEEIANELRECAKIISEVDTRMENIKNRIRE
ncbi:MAG: GTP pyrophosphokinase family protein [Lachnospiraceae bacterium]|uniref:GTP pyrophosphokinase n=1 Tax=Falcatimonas sp. MSJ-15 TaxID=2841515 RepID=UPI001C0FCAD8|nr:GTP pyrophosphokinase family protein [Falcatimonas sp. MSJ-15]MBU5470460.1 GTP pyrophosphokinase family protein [Falcatimonas sp. MSJ-15]MEE0960073.1 GTP pyrophosphokinase family protein [Lachnospiraceae bacterium]